MEGHEAILKVSTSALQLGLKTRELTEQSHGIETIKETGSTTRGPQEIKAGGDGTEKWTSRPLAILFLHIRENYPRSRLFKREKEQ